MGVLCTSFSVYIENMSSTSRPDEESLELYNEKQLLINKHTDSLFKYVLIFQFVFANLLVWIVSPRTWIGATSEMHIHCYVTFALSILLTGFPLACIKFDSGSFFTRSVIATAQLLYSALLIHITGGRIETHFHIFGSLAFLAFYRDMKVIVIATLITVLDHVIRGYAYPLSIFGVTLISDWRWIEHALWVVFEDIFLYIFIHKTREELLTLSMREAELKGTYKKIEKEVEVKTKDLKEQSLKLQASNEELSQFAYIASHDLREPLRGINNQTSFIIEDYAEQLDDYAMKKLNRVQFLSQRIEKFLDDLLFYSRVSRIDLSYDSVDINSIVDDIKISLEHKLETGKYLIEVNRALPVVNCDKARISEIFRNLIENAFKYNDKEIKIVEINFCKKDELDRSLMDSDVYDTMSENELIFYVKDNGIGITEENYKKVFQIFTRLHKKEQFGGGSGSGLTLVKKIIERHNGAIWIDSKYEESTTFYFHLNEQSRLAAV